MSNRKEILDLLASGKISAAEAANLLNNPTPEAPAAPPAEPAKPAPTTVQPTTNRNQPAWFRVRVKNLDSGKNKVSVNIPVSMLKLGLKIGKRLAPELQGIDWNEISGMMTDMQSGLLVEVEDEESNEHVQVYLD